MLERLLIANIENYRAGSNYLNRTGSFSDHSYLIMAIVAIAAFWVGLYYWDRHRKQSGGGGDTPRALFMELARAHNLGRADRVLLWNATEAAKLEQPAAIFVNPDILAEMSVGNQVETGMYQKLRVLLFGSDIDE